MTQLDRVERAISSVNITLQEARSLHEHALEAICEQRMEELFAERQAILDSIPTQREP